MSEEGKYVYVGTASCGCRVAVCVDDPEHKKRTGQWVKEMVENGYTVARESLADFRVRSIAHCTHDDPEQLSLTPPPSRPSEGEG